MARRSDSCTLRYSVNAPDRFWPCSACTQYIPTSRELVLWNRARAWACLAALQQPSRHRLGTSSFLSQFGGSPRVEHLTHLRRCSLDRRLRFVPSRQVTTNPPAVVKMVLDRDLLLFLLDLLALFLLAASQLVLAFLTIRRERSTRFLVESHRLFVSHNYNGSVACTAVGGILALASAMTDHGRVFWYCESGVRCSSTYEGVRSNVSEWSGDMPW